MKECIGLRRKIINLRSTIHPSLDYQIHSSLTLSTLHQPRGPFEHASIQIQKVATFNSDRKEINLIPNKSISYYSQ